MQWVYPLLLPKRFPALQNPSNRCFHFVIEKCGNDYYLRDKIDRLCYIIKGYILGVSGHKADTISVKVANVGSVVQYNSEHAYIAMCTVYTFNPVYGLYGYDVLIHMYHTLSYTPCSDISKDSFTLHQNRQHNNYTVCSTWSVGASIDIHE